MNKAGSRPGCLGSWMDLLRNLRILVPVAITALLAISPFIDFSGANPGPVDYYFPYYDNTPPAGVTLDDQISITNLGTGDATVEIFLEGYGAVPCDPVTSGASPRTVVAPAEGGPLRITSVSGQPLLVSRLVHYGDDFEQIYAVPGTEADTDVFFTWYDNSSPGWASSLVMANPGGTDAAVSVYIDEILRGSYTVPAGGSASQVYPGLAAGPVRLVSTNGQPIIASQRIINDGKFSETPGIPVHDFSSHYFWTVYQCASPENAWVMAFNPNPTPVFYQVHIGGILKSTGMIDPYSQSISSYPGETGGPVEIEAWSDSGHTAPANIMASQRMIRNGKFREEPGTPAAELDSTVDLAFHIEGSNQLGTSLYIANTGTATADVYLYVESSGTNASLTIEPDGLAHPTLPGTSGGAVRISSINGQPIIASELIEPAAPPIAPENIHYFTWYDNLFGLTWVMMASPAFGGGNSFEQFLGNQHLNATPVTVSPGQAKPERYNAGFGGPLKVISGNSGDSLISERSLFGNSFEEIWATPYSELDSYYRWPWYDGYSSNEWIMVANPLENNEDIQAIVTLYLWDPDMHTTHELEQTRVLAPGESWPCSFPGHMADSVAVNAYRAAGTRGNPDDARKVIASRRTLYKGAFNEMPGIPSRNFSSTWGWPWYDNQSAGSSSWIIVNNPGTQPSSLYVMLVIGDSFATIIPDALVPQGSWAIYVPDIMDGPAVVYGCWDRNDCLNTPAPIVATQRSIWGNSFSEIAGERGTDTKTTNAHWTWYDEKSPGSVNYVMISNMEEVEAYYEVRLAGELIGSGNIAPHASATPDYRGRMDGPLQVDAWISDIDPATGLQRKITGADIMASQRVLWNGYFNEIFGKSL